MREILFRGKRTENDEWIKGAYIPNCPSTGDTFKPGIYLQANYGGTFRVDPTTVGQATEYTDINGKQIFEGDIVYCLTDEHTYRVEWDTESENEVVMGGFGLFPFGYHNQPGIALIDTFVEDAANPILEIIGNIYDNPELTGGD